MINNVFTHFDTRDHVIDVNAKLAKLLIQMLLNLISVLESQGGLSGVPAPSIGNLEPTLPGSSLCPPGAFFQQYFIGRTNAGMWPN